MLNWRRPYSPGPLTEPEFEQYWTDGFVIKRSALSPKKDIQPCLNATEAIVDDVASRLMKAGLIHVDCSSLDVFHRLPALEKQFSEASVLVHKYGTLPSAFAALWSHPNLLSIAQQLLGPAVAGHPTWNLRAATPRQTAAVVPWHQDNAYTGKDSWNTLQVTAWIPLMSVSPHTGCLQLLRGGHKAGLTAKHTGVLGDTWYVCLDESAAASDLGVDFARDVVTAEMQEGDVLLFNNIIPHRSLTNVSSSMRWSLDLRWQNPQHPAGTFGLKPLIPMTAEAAAVMAQQRHQHADGVKSDSTNSILTSGSQAFEIPWEGWISQSRQVEAAAAQGDTATTSKNAGFVVSAADTAAVGAADVSTIVVGPWLDTWEIVNDSKHTRAWKAMQQACSSTGSDIDGGDRDQVS